MVGDCLPGLALAAPVRIVRASTAASIKVMAQAITAVAPAAQMKFLFLIGTRRLTDGSWIAMLF